MPAPFRVKLSIIIPAYNEEKLIASSLSSIQKALVPAVRLGYDPELIVVDNNSDDRTAELAAQFGARVVFEPIHQISRVRNAGASAANGDWLIFIDADCWPEAALINDVLDCIRDQGVMGGGSVLKMEDMPFLFNLMIGLWNGLSRIFRWAAGSFIFCRADAFRDIGGFSLEYFVAEEIDFSVRAKRWARERGKRFTILHRHPLMTSGRKFHLYSRGERFRTLWDLLLRPRRFMRDRRLCYLWYDGRR